MSIKSRTIQSGKIAIIEVKGLLIGDKLTDEFRAEVNDFIEQGNRYLILDLHRVSYINSSGLGAMISVHTSYMKNGGEVKLVGITKNIRNLLIVTRLMEVFDVCEDIEEAIKKFEEKEIKKTSNIIN